MPLVQLRLVDSDGAEVECHDKPGEILIKGPNVVPAYLASDQPVQDADGWLHTGDVGLIKLSEKTGHEHLFIVDRLKDIIKVKACNHHKPLDLPIDSAIVTQKEGTSDTHVSKYRGSRSAQRILRRCYLRTRQSRKPPSLVSRMKMPGSVRRPTSALASQPPPPPARVRMTFAGASASS